MNPVNQKTYYNLKEVKRWKSRRRIFADIVVNDVVIIELKSVRRIIKSHEVQLVNYLVATGKPVGLILNFGERKVEIKRKVKACPGATQ